MNITSSFKTPPWVEKIIFYFKPMILWMLVLLSVVGVMFWLIVELREEKKILLDDEDSQGVLPGQSIKKLFDKLSNKISGIASSLAVMLDSKRARRNRASARIRQIYSDLLDLSERLGTVRPAGNTPLEFLPKLLQTFPGCREDLQSITSSYLIIRYGQYSETIQDLTQVERA